MLKQDTNKTVILGMAFKKEFTVGDLIQVIVLLVGVVGAYFSLSARISLLEREVEFQKELVNTRIGSMESLLNNQVMELDKKIEKYDSKIEKYEQLLRETYKK